MRCGLGTSRPPGLIWKRRRRRCRRSARHSDRVVHVNLGWVLRQEADPDGARSMFGASLRTSRRNGDRAGIAYASLGLACLAADQGDWHQAGHAARRRAGPS